MSEPKILRLVREWISPAAVLWTLNELVENNEFSYLTEKLDWYFLPVTNPDGYAFTWEKKEQKDTNGRYWRNPENTDLNRNFGVRAETCSRIENTNTLPEVQNVKDLISTREGDWVVFDDVHAYGKLILLPWQGSRNQPDNYGELLEIAETGAMAMKTATPEQLTYKVVVFNLSNFK